MPRRRKFFIYHVYATYDSKHGVIHQFDGIVESNAKIDREDHLDVTRHIVAVKLAKTIGYTPPKDNVVIQSLTFLHERLK